jgi:20S proteasome alpha/beta subunit
MTLILAITCKDGVVLASDGLAINPISGELIKSKYPKIFKLGQNRLWGCSGSTPDIAWFSNILSKTLRETKNRPLSDFRLRKRLEATAPKIKANAEALAREKMHISPSDALPSGLVRCPQYLVVGHQRYPIVWQMADNCESVFFNRDQNEMTHCCIFTIGTGIGQWVARAFFERVKDVCNEYTVTQGSLMAYRIIKEAIKASALVGEPIEVWTICNDVVEQKKDEELKELERFYNDWTDKERHISQDFLSSVS